MLAFHAELGRSLTFGTSRFLPGEGRGLDPARIPSSSRRFTSSRPLPFPGQPDAVGAFLNVSHPGAWPSQKKKRFKALI